MTFRLVELYKIRQFSQPVIQKARERIKMITDLFKVMAGLRVTVDFFSNKIRFYFQNTILSIHEYLHY